MTLRDDLGLSNLTPRDALAFAFFGLLILVPLYI